MSRSTSRIGVIAIALLSVVTASIAVVVAFSSGGGPVSATSPSATQTITVSGDGTAQGIPDTLVVNLGVHSHQASVAAALNAVATDRNHMVSTLKGKGVAAKNIQTTDLELNPSYDNHGTITGYDASESLSVRIPLSNVSKTLAAAATSAGNSATIDGMSLDISDKSAVLDRARQNAFSQAYEAAKTDAQLAHESLGHVVSIKESQANQRPPVPFGVNDLAASASAAKSIAISPGRQAVTVTLDVVWALQ